jgi:hypothetical protein
MLREYFVNTSLLLSERRGKKGINGLLSERRGKKGINGSSRPVFSLLRETVVSGKIPVGWTGQIPAD